MSAETWIAGGAHAHDPPAQAKYERRQSMKRITAAALSLALIAGSAGAMAQTSGSSTPANAKPMTGKKETAAQAHWRHHNDPAGDRYTEALNTLGAGGYTGISN